VHVKMRAESSLPRVMSPLFQRQGSGSGCHSPVYKNVPYAEFEPYEAPDRTKHQTVQREMNITKPSKMPFGLSVARIHRCIYVAEVREESVAWRTGLRRFDRYGPPPCTGVSFYGT
jgi:hypothetical protein